jgi:hypothetical protein
MLLMIAVAFERDDARIVRNLLAEQMADGGWNCQRRARCVNGRWPLQNTWPGKVFFALERGGRPSRWNTLRALRVLRWWQGRS